MEDSRIHTTFRSYRERYPGSAKPFEEMIEEDKYHWQVLLETYEKHFAPGDRTLLNWHAPQSNRAYCQQHHQLCNLGAWHPRHQQKAVNDDTD